VRRKEKQQIPFRNDRKKSKGKGNSGFPLGMTTRRARAKDRFSGGNDNKTAKAFPVGWSVKRSLAGGADYP
jgi:hypothetical protein